MNNLVELVERLKKTSIKDIVEKRMNEFEELGKKDSNEFFKELCFCFLTANFNAEGGIRIQKEIGDGFLYLNEKELSEKLKEL
jgi:N-glycosylase/DNA lyase|tara:strand:+ start:4662 stop:4910 length:249 start_codon:yes stop_codon:yes gene_type:complete